MWSRACFVLAIAPLLVRPLNAHTEALWGRASSFLDRVNRESHGPAPDTHRHAAAAGAPCDVCPGRARCVPRVQCPALLRAPPPLCHLPAGHVGVCCTTGHSHASASDHQQRSASSSLGTDALRAAHRRSQQRAAEWSQHERHLAASAGVHLPTSSPSYGHHLSTKAVDVEKANALGRGALRNLFATQELKQRQAIADDQLRLALPISSDSPFCPTPPECPPQPTRYRRADGACNSAANPLWGAAHTVYERVLPPDYGDGTWSLRGSSAGGPLAGARVVSQGVLRDAEHASATHSALLTLFGQFLAHDVTASVPFTLANGSAISCCAADGAFLPPELQHPACAAIALPDADPFYSRFRQGCMSFVRAQLAPAHDCELGYARQMNGVSHCADLSPIYGSSEDKMASLREADTGRLAVFSDFGRDLPPLGATSDDCLQQQDGSACFASGDDHVNQMISLVALHTLWIREHNRLAEAFASMNPSWPPDIVFLEARRLLIAEYQHILYNEWLPSVIGPQHMEVFKLSPRHAGEYSADYSADVNPSITNEVAAAALRFGHSVVGAKLTIPGPERVYEEVAIPEVMFQPSRMRLRHFLDRLLIGLSWQPMQTVDPLVTEALTRYMFHAGQPFGLDLAAINVQRGRDHGLPSYNQYRRLAGAEPFTRFSQFSTKAAERLASAYAAPEDLDLWVGGLLEPPLPDAAVGATFADLLADQFSRMRRGDRYFYEHGPDVNPAAFTREQLVEIKKVSMARVVCDNSDGIDLHVHAPRAFLLPTLPGNEPVPCDSIHIPRMDLSKFKEL